MYHHRLCSFIFVYVAALTGYVSTLQNALFEGGAPFRTQCWTDSHFQTKWLHRSEKSLHHPRVHKPAQRNWWASDLDAKPVSIGPVYRYAVPVLRETEIPNQGAVLGRATATYCCINGWKTGVSSGRETENRCESWQYSRTAGPLWRDSILPLLPSSDWISACHYDPSQGRRPRPFYFTGQIIGICREVGLYLPVRATPELLPTPGKARFAILTLFTSQRKQVCLSLVADFFLSR